MYIQPEHIPTIENLMVARRRYLNSVYMGLTVLSRAENVEEVIWLARMERYFKSLPEREILLTDAEFQKIRDFLRMCRETIKAGLNRPLNASKRFEAHSILNAVTVVINSMEVQQYGH